MFMLKNKAAMKCIAAATFLALASCSKKDEAPAPEKTADTYQVKTIYFTGTPVDSFIYANNQIVENWIYDEDDKAYRQKSLYTYGADGRLLRSVNYQNYRQTNMYLRSTDSIGWKPEKVIIYSVFYAELTGAAVSWDTTTLKLDANNRLALFNTKDTLSSGTGKTVNYTEWGYTGNNITTFNDVYYYSGNTSSDDFRYVMEYGKLVNPLYGYVSKNPILALDLSDMHASLLSQNNVTKVTAVGRNGENQTVTSTTVTGTDIVQENTFQGNSGVFKITYGLVKLPK